MVEARGAGRVNLSGRAMGGLGITPVIVHTGSPRRTGKLCCARSEVWYAGGVFPALSQGRSKGVVP